MGAHVHGKRGRAAVLSRAIRAFFGVLATTMGLPMAGKVAATAVAFHADITPVLRSEAGITPANKYILDIVKTIIKESLKLDDNNRFWGC